MQNITNLTIQNVVLRNKKYLKYAIIQQLGKE